MNTRIPFLLSGRFALSLSVALAITVSTSSAQSTWSGGNANWSSNGNPGWNGTGVPDGAGTTGILNTAGTATVDSAITVGTISYTGAPAGTRSISNSSGITFDNNGAGALIENAATSGSGILSFGGGGASGIILADNLTISNVNANVSGAGVRSISFSTGAGAAIHGTGNLTFSNVSNNLNVGHIFLDNSSGTDFTGTVLVESGAVTFNGSNAFGGKATNTITLGSAGSGSASLAQNGTNTTNLVNNVVVAAGTGGTLLLGALSNNNGTTQYSGNILLNDDVSLLSNKSAAATGFVLYSGTLSGVGGVTTLGTDTTAGFNRTRLGNGTTTVINTYSGDTILDQRSHLWLSDNAALTFYIGANDVNNQITSLTSTTTLTLDGDFVFDLNSAAALGTWTIVDIGTFGAGQVLYGGTFSVTDFTENTPGVWSRDFNGSTYTFTESTGILQAVPEPSAMLLLALGGTVVLVCRRRGRAL